ncbi:uncharacterized protein LOC130903396 [Diorhabda carinulata]|uniref:uncharacterized protein LOC130903396 n=1 Tax=Diorhabda carinulata TaxID=1163345 RepID=UPI0025A20275|nr:uncharacterized protein LOC130903396 [Diorhabda carinulata]
MNDDVCIKRKLIFDGELGDESRVNKIQRMVCKWLITNYNSSEENQLMYNEICYQLSLLEYSKRKSLLVQKNYQEEFSRYQKYINEMEKNIKDITKTIESSKTLLSDVENIKNRKINYEMIARDIVMEPSREETCNYIEQLEQNLVMNRLIEKQLEEEWSNCKKHTTIITSTSVQLKSIMENSVAFN